MDEKKTERRIISAAEAKEEAGKTTKKKAAEEPEKKKKKAEPEEEKPAKKGKAEEEEKPAKKAKDEADDGEATEKGGSVKGLRIGAIILWVLALACEVGAFFALRYAVMNNALTFGTQEVWLLIGALVLDAIFCIIAAQLWKKSNRIRPCLADSKLVRTLWHQLGVIMVLVCILPIGILLLLKSDKMDKKTKTILIALVAALFVGSTAASVDFQQPSAEEVAALQEEAIAENAGTIYWTRYGKSYHFDPDCQSLRRSATLISGTLDEAFEANRWDPCDFCANGGAEKADAADTVLDDVADTAEDTLEDALEATGE